jgi:Ca-activated chloride channel family protein
MFVDALVLRFIHLSFLYLLAPLTLLALMFRLRWYKKVVYVYALVDAAVKNNVHSSHPYKKVLAVMRLIVLLLVGLAALEPQLVDSTSRVKSQGIDIVIALDVSGSMRMTDFSDDDRSRLEIAKDEAINFVHKRHNDAIGMTIFGRDAVSRCPLTHDKKMVEYLIGNIDFTAVDEGATVLARGILVALNRLRSSTARSKIIVVLTDGEPTPSLDIAIATAITVAKEMGVKIYTIGIGGDKPVHIGWNQVMPGVNVELLQRIARETGGQFYLAHSRQGMRSIYEIIDKLEASDKEVPLFSRYEDLGGWCMWGALGVLLTEWLVSSTIWFGL